MPLQVIGAEPADSGAKSDATTDAAATTQPQTSQKPAFDLLTAPTLSGDWFGYGPAMRDLGVDVQYYWNSHFYSNMGGGRKTGMKHSATYDLFINLDFERMGLIEGGGALVQGRQQWGTSVNSYTGATQQVNDDADGDRSLYVDQLYYRQSFLKDKFMLHVGYLDYQTIVDRNRYANSEDKQFMNETLDNNPLIPTASATGLGAVLFVQPCKWYTMILGAGDAERLPLYKPGFSTTFHDHALFLGYLENDFHVELPTKNGPLPGNYRFGVVYDPLQRNHFREPGQTPKRSGDNVAFYMSHDQMLWRERAEDTLGLGCFFRYGYQKEDTYRFNQFLSGGFVYEGLLPERDKDVLGLAYSVLLDSAKYRQRINPRSGDESVYELYYAIHVTPWLVLTPDFQYIDNPGGASRIGHAWAGGLRIRVTF